MLRFRGLIVRTGLTQMIFRMIPIALALLTIADAASTVDGAVERTGRGGHGRGPCQGGARSCVRHVLGREPIEEPEDAQSQMPR